MLPNNYYFGITAATGGLAGTSVTYVCSAFVMSPTVTWRNGFSCVSQSISVVKQQLLRNFTVKTHGLEFVVDSAHGWGITWPKTNPAHCPFYEMFQWFTNLDRFVWSIRLNFPVLNQQQKRIDSLVSNVQIAESSDSLSFVMTKEIDSLATGSINKSLASYTGSGMVS